MYAWVGDRMMDGQRGQMSVDAIDFVKSYYLSTRRIQTLVRVVDENNEPVDGAKVQLDMTQLERYAFSLSGYTDRRGVATFDIGETDPGILKVDVRDIQHPCYRFESFSSLIQPRHTEI